MQKWIIMLIMGVSVLAASGCAGTVYVGSLRLPNRRRGAPVPAI